MSKQKRFTQEEKLAKVRMITENGRTVLSMANELGLHENTLWKWKRLYDLNHEEAFKRETCDDPADETERLKRQIRELEKEVEFLKKVSAYFARNPQ